MDINDLRDLLSKEVLVITFRKKDNSLRTMICTTRSEFLPGATDDYVNNSQISDTIVTVWDVENDGWRSFRFDSLNSIESK